MEASAVTSTPDAVPIPKQAEALSLTAGMVDQAAAFRERCSFKMLSGRRLQSGLQAGMSTPCPCSRGGGGSELAVVEPRGG